MKRAALGLPLALLLAASQVLAQVTETVRIAAPDLRAEMTGVVFLPPGKGPFPVVVYSHGRSGTEVERARTRPPGMQSHVRYWIDRGFAVVAPIRPGYGATGGVDRDLTQADGVGRAHGLPLLVLLDGRGQRIDGVADRDEAAKVGRRIEWTKRNSHSRMLLVGDWL